MEALPSGTVTILFSDIEGSTRLLARLGNRFTEALDAHRALLRAAWTRWGGREIGTEGDSFFVVFEVAGDAVAAALQAQRSLARYDWTDGEQVRVRIGLHTGEPVVHGHGYVGMDVHRAARIAAAAHGGQVVVSNITRELALVDALAGVTFVDLGWHRLKDLSGPEHLFQVTQTGEDAAAFPALRSLGAVSNLPTPATPLVGRADELRSLAALLERARLVTLTGAGGSGKTRLAIALAHSKEQMFRDGVYFVSLATATTRAEMWTEIAIAVGTGGEGWDHSHLLDSIRARQLLLVLDNLEQLSDAAKVVAEVLSAAPEVVVVATSRRPLHLQAEHEHEVSPLRLPDELDLDHVKRSAATRLFVQHARLVRPGFTVTAENCRAVAGICERLDGLPLAIELAASRTKLLSPAALLARLDETMRLGAPDADRPNRQRTLEAAIRWSYDLLSADAQRAFRQFGVFAGGGDLDAVAAVVMPDRDPLEVVAGLVDVSLVNIGDASDGEPRVTLLRTVSDFAVACLTEAGESDDARRRHAEHYLACAESEAAALDAGTQLVWARDRLEAEHDNMAAAMSWALAPGADGRPEDPVVALRLGAALWRFWVTTGRLVKARTWLEQALATAAGPDPAVRARALSGAGTVAWRQGDHDAATSFHAEALALQQAAGDTEGAAFSLNNLGAQALERHDLEAADRYFDAATGLTRSARISTYLLNNMAEVARERGELQRAADLLDQALEASVQVGDEWLLAGLLNNVARVAVAAGRVAGAAHVLADALGPVRRSHDRSHVADWSDALAGLAASVGQTETAVSALGAADGVRDALGIKRSAADIPSYDATCVTARAALGDAIFDSLYAGGRDLSAEQSIAAGARALERIRQSLPPG